MLFWFMSHLYTVDYNSIIFSPPTIRDTDAVESVQGRFTKRLLCDVPYHERSVLAFKCRPIVKNRNVFTLYAHLIGVTTLLFALLI